MLFRLFLSGALVCGLLAMSATASAESAEARMFTGKTAQRHKLKAAVTGRKMKVLRFKASLKCRDGSTLILTESGFLPTRLRGGSFKDVQYGRTDTVRFRGRLKGRKLRGKLRVIDKTKKLKCKSRWISFSAKRR